MYNCTVIKQTRVRNQPSIFATGTIMLSAGYTFSTNTEPRVVTEDVNGVNVTGTWLQLPDGNWTAGIYKEEKFVDFSLSDKTNPTLVHIIEVYSDGSLVIDNIPYV